MPGLLSWNEIRARAQSFVNEWQFEVSERAESQSFWNDFFNVFGIKRRRVVIFEKKAANLSNISGKGRIDAFWPGNILIEHKSRGSDLSAAAVQAADYFHGLKEAELPRAILVCDFHRFNFIDLDNQGQETTFTISQFPDYVGLFGFLVGYEKQVIRETIDLNLEATKLMADIHVSLEEAGFVGHQLEVLLVRLMFCLFADDSAIFEKGLFREFIETRTHEDGSDMGSKLNTLFEVLDTPEDRRQQHMDEMLKAFPYIDGRLFEEQIRTAFFDSQMRLKVLGACDFNWGQISPAIFGSLFQSIMNKDERRNLGAHYTSEGNILRLIGPLFLDELWKEFKHLRNLKIGKRKRLNEFHDKLAQLRFLDPACGCGNFLVIAYRELRALELEVLKELTDGETKSIDIRFLIKVDVDQMNGIEMEEWPARIAETALWLTDHQMNRKLLEMGLVYLRLPLLKSPRIIVGNALRIDWESVVSPNELSYILGNPPFVGSKYQSAEQRSDMKLVFQNVAGYGVLDYVTAWYKKAADFIRNTTIHCAFVSTNSITQGEQVGIIWSWLMANGIEIYFAHRTFAWDSEAPGAAHVHVVIIGFGASNNKRKSIYDYKDIKGDPQIVSANQINPYLLDGPDVFIYKRSEPVCDVPRAGIGNKPIDGGYYLFAPEEKEDFLKVEPNAAPYFKRWIGSNEFLNCVERWCLWLGDASPKDIKSMPHCAALVNKVRRYRLGEIPAKDKSDCPNNKKRNEQTQKLAASPTRFHVENFPGGHYLIIPKVSSERRVYIPLDFGDPNEICSDLVILVSDATLYHFGVLSSSMHMAWVNQIAGRLESRYRYSIKLVYNNFPWPENPTSKKIKTIERASEAVLSARLEYSECSLSDLYDPLTMPRNLLRAHKELDKAVDKAYLGKSFAGAVERLQHLFKLYDRKLKELSLSAI